ncbi:MAG TPA: hypothetical protein VJ301_11680 [Propionibacteriaceae bacterium]|nr:hypothetical protein [Propionibacteriaceae bacterium]
MREQLYQYYLGASRAGLLGRERESISPLSMYNDAWMRALADREGLNEQERPVRPPNPSEALRDVEHALAAQVGHRTGSLGGFGGHTRVPPLMAVPAYNALKWAAQAEPRVLGPTLDWAANQTGVSDIPQVFTQGTPPSWRAVQWGLRPYLRED